MEGNAFEITTEPGNLETVRAALENGGYNIVNAEVQRIPQNTVKLDRKGAEQMLRLYEMLDSSDDVQKVSANFEIDDDLLEELMS